MSVPMIELNNLGGNQWEAVLVFGSGPKRAEVRYHFTDPQRSPGDFDSAVRRGAHALDVTFTTIRRHELFRPAPKRRVCRFPTRLEATFGMLGSTAPHLQHVR